MNKTAILKAASGLTYDELAIVLNIMDIEITRSALGARASAPTDKFFVGDDYLNLTKGLENPTKETETFVQNLLDSHQALSDILQLYFANTSEDDLSELVDDVDLLDVDSSDEFDDFDDFADLNDETKGDDDAQSKTSKKKSTKKKSKGGDTSHKKKKDKEKVKSKKKDKKSKKNKKSKKKDDLDDIDALLNGDTKSGKKTKKKSLKNKSGKGEPWVDAADLRDVSKADPVNDDDSFEDNRYEGQYDDSDFDINLDDI